MKKCLKNFFLLVVLAVIICFSGCKECDGAKDINVHSLEIYSDENELPALKMGGKSVDWTDFFCYDKDEYLYVYKNKLCSTEKAPESFVADLNLVYREDESLHFVVRVEKKKVELESLEIKLNETEIFNDSTVSFTLIPYPSNARIGNFNLTFDKENFVENIDGNKFTLNANIEEDSTLQMHISTETGIATTQTIIIKKRNVYHIYNIKQLNMINNDPKGYYYLEKDLEFGENEYYRSVAFMVCLMVMVTQFQIW